MIGLEKAEREGVIEAQRLISQVLVPLFKRVPLREGESERKSETAKPTL